MAVFETKHLRKTFGGVHAVDNVDLSFEAGKITALIGPNGSGQTTLINVVTGLLSQDGGVIVAHGEERTRIKPHEIASLGVTRTFQSVRLIEQISVLDNILMVLTERNVWGALIERHSAQHLKRAEEVLKKVGLWEKRDAHAEKLSYGQRKLLEIGRAIAMDARVYFFDEPFAGLFREVARKISDSLQELKEGGAAVILVEHNMDIIRDLADRCYVLDSGKVIAEGTPEEVLRDHVVLEAYLGK